MTRERGRERERERKRERQREGEGESYSNPATVLTNAGWTEFLSLLVNVFYLEKQFRQFWVRYLFYIQFTLPI